MAPRGKVSQGPVRGILFLDKKVQIPRWVLRKVSPSARVQPDSRCPGPGTDLGLPAPGSLQGKRSKEALTDPVPVCQVWCPGLGDHWEGPRVASPLCSGPYALLCGGEEIMGAPTPARSGTRVEIRSGHRTAGCSVGPGTPRALSTHGFWFS